MVLNYLSLMTHDVRHLLHLRACWPFVFLLGRNVYSTCSPILIVWFVFLLLNCRNSLHILDTSLFLGIYDLQIFYSYPYIKFIVYSVPLLKYELYKTRHLFLSCLMMYPKCLGTDSHCSINICWMNMLIYFLNSNC